MVSTEKSHMDEIQCYMKKLFTEEEISIVSKKLENGKSPEVYNMYAEYVKYTPGTTHQIITDILVVRNGVT